MKKALLLVLLIPISVIAQTPFGHNATWHFTFSEFGSTGYIKIAYNQDTSFGGVVWQYFTKTGIREVKTGPKLGDVMQTPINEGLFLRTQNDSVFRWNGSATGQLIYDFNAAVGDTWVYGMADSSQGCNSVPVATVVNIGFDMINGVSTKYWEVIPPKNAAGDCTAPACLEGKIYRDFGQYNYNVLFGASPNMCNGGSFQLNTYNLRCFSNGTLSFNTTNQACNYWSLIGIDEHAEQTVKIYPNPSNGLVHIDANTQIKTATIFDLTGKRVGHFANPKTVKIPAPNGLYFLQVQFENGAIVTRKVMRH